MVFTHPSLEIFYSGDKTNLVCKVDVEGCADVSEGECVVICQEPGERSVSSDISKIVVLNDNVLWTASGSLSIRRWKVLLRRVIRAERLNVDDTIARTESPMKKWVTMQSMESLISVSPPTSTNRPESFLTVNSSLDKAKEKFLFGFKNLVKLTSPNDPLTQLYASLYSAARIMSHRQRG